MLRSIISLSKIIHQMWLDHPFSLRKKATKRASSGGRGGGSAWTKFENEELAM